MADSQEGKVLSVLERIKEYETDIAKHKALGEYNPLRKKEQRHGASRDLTKVLHHVQKSPIEPRESKPEQVGPRRAEQKPYQMKEEIPPSLHISTDTNDIRIDIPTHKTLEQGQKENDKPVGRGPSSDQTKVLQHLESPQPPHYDSIEEGESNPEKEDSHSAEKYSYKMHMSTVEDNKSIGPDDEDSMRGAELDPEQQLSETKTLEEEGRAVLEYIGLSVNDICNISHCEAISLYLNQAPSFLLDYLKKLMMLDYRFRDDLLYEHDMESLQTDQTQTDVAQNSNGSITFFGQANKHDINPMDVLFAIFISADHAFRLIIMEKLFVCKLALPFLAPKTWLSESSVFLWAMRSLVADWKVDGRGQELGLTEHPLFVISALRFGNSIKSKSAVLNSLLSETPHHTFYNRKCLLGRSHRRFTNGLIEAAVYLPGGKKQDLMKRVGLILNLRGDGQYYKQQADFLGKASHVLAVFLDVDYLVFPANQSIVRSILLSNAHILLMCSASNAADRKRGERLMNELLQPISQKDVQVVFLQEDGIPFEERRQIIKCLKKRITADGGRKLEEIAEIAKGCGIFCDEDLDTIKKPKRLVKEFYDFFSQTDNPKHEILRLQGKPWKHLVEIERSMMNAKSNLTEESVETKKSKLRELRGDQLAMLNEENSFYVFNCINQLRETTGLSQLATMIMWYKLYFDTHSRKELPKLRAKQNDTYKSYRTAIQDHKPDGEIKEHLRRVKECEKAVEDASFGIEHIFREIGQVYEALVSLPHDAQQWGKLYAVSLLDIAVTALLSGLPFEVMNGDGDMSNIPATWVNAVIERLKKKAGNQKIFVVSVIGVQSTGKSTLLNTMFGIQFAVSAGRCTKGIFIQLIPVHGAEYEYVLIVDTEGLRANEKLRVRHDNELATIAVGIGDVTIVNMKGENTEQVKECLSIVVHAFIRIKAVHPNIKLHQKCIFVHQNVSATDAEEKLDSGQKELVESLDQITVNAARNENVRDINQFSDVIQFDMLKDKCIWYMPDLWHGSPPMAHVNSDYTDMVTELKNYIFEECAGQQSSFLRLDEFRQRLQDLWRAIISDDFVYNFRNQLEVRAHHDLEIEYGEICLELENQLTILLQGLDLSLEKADLQTAVELGSTAKKKLLSQSITLHTELKKRLEHFFQTHDHKEILLQWKTTRIEQFNRFKGRKLDGTADAIDEMIGSIKRIHEESREQAICEEKLRKVAALVATQVTSEKVKKDGKVDTTHNDIKSPFDKEMNAMMGRLREQVSSSDCQVDIHTESKLQLVKCLPSGIQNLVLERMMDSHKTQNSIAKLYVMVFNETVAGLSKLHDTYMQKYGIIAHLEAYKETAWGLYDHLVNKDCSEQIAAYMLCTRLEKIITKAVHKSIYNQVTNVLAQHFSGKSSVLTASLEYLIQKEEFRGFIDYASNSKIYTLKWLEEYATLQDLFPKELIASYEKPKIEWWGRFTRFFKSHLPMVQTNALENYAKVLVEKYWRDVKAAVKETKDAKYDTLDDWILKFRLLLTETLPTSTFDFKQVAEYPFDNMDKFQCCIIDQLPKIEEKALKKYKGKNIRDFKWSADSSPYQKILDNIWGCEELCPFCAEPCQLSKGHEEETPHRCIQHKPLGIVGIANAGGKPYLVTRSCSVHVALGDTSFGCMQGRSKRLCVNCRPGDYEKTHPYKDYKQYTDGWYIEPSATADNFKFWQYVFNRFNGDFATFYNCQPVEIPNSWKKISKEQAIRSLHLAHDAGAWVEED